MNILDNAAVEQLKENIENNMQYYFQYGEPWVQNVVEGLNDTDLTQDNILILSEESSYDKLNAIKIHEKYKDLPLSLASSDHFWTTLAHTKFYKYMKTRWPVTEKTKPSNIKSRYFFSSTNQKSRTRHGLARLWWVAHLTYDENNQEDPYYYTSITTEDQELYSLIMETKHIAQNKRALFAMLDIAMNILELQKKGEIGKFNRRDFYRSMMQQINLIGSVTVWDILTQEEAKKQLADFSKRYLEIEKLEEAVT